jgi:UDP-N-acetylglucosamine 2-epimerase (non-hydrolysing)
MKIVSVVGARPNFMKIAPFIRAVRNHNITDNKLKIEHLLVHTGQHYDDRMSNSFFKDLNIPEPDINLGIGSGSHAEQVGKTMIEFEKVLQTEKPDWVVVVGDVNATLACSVTAKKENVKLCHIEAGLRSGDMTMPEEINRLVTDRLSDLLLTPDRISSENLRQEGVAENKICFVGNIMIDTLEENRAKVSELKPADIIKKNLLFGDAGKDLGNKDLSGFAVITLHRPSNVDDPEILSRIVKFLADDVSENILLIWSIHPRTLKQLEKSDLLDSVRSCPNIILLHPVDYHSMLRLNMEARVMLTDSGGLQEECTVLGTPCITMRYNTERPVTLKEHGGISVLVGNNIDKLRKEFYAALHEKRHPVKPELWDGKTAQRCLEAIIRNSR